MSQRLLNSNSRQLPLDDAFSSLQSHLEEMESQHQGLSVQLHEHCSVLLRESLALLFKVIQSVNKADKTLVDWHHRSDGVKAVLRVMKLDRRTQTAIDKKTEKLKAEIAEVEQEFNRTQKTFDNTLDAIRLLNHDFRQFSFEMIRDATKHANQVHDSHNQDNQSMKESSLAMDEKLENIKSASKPLQDTLSSVSWNIRGATVSRTYYNMVSSMSYGLATGTYYGSYLFPPASYITTKLNAIGESYAATATKCEASISQLEKEGEILNRKLREHQVEVAIITDKLTELKVQSEGHVQAMERAQTIKTSSLELRSKAQNNLEDLRKAQIELGSTREKIKQIALELHESGYSRSRREIAVRLREALHLIADVGKKRRVALNQNEIDKAMNELLQVDKLTREVVGVIDKAEQATAD